jgi:serine protease Do
LRGEVIGILTAIATQSGGNEGVAFVMPINTVHRIAEQLIQTGSAVKPFAGFGLDAAFSQNDRQKIGIDRMIGAKIKSIEPNAPADQAGLKVGDIVLTFGNTEVEDDLHLVHLVADAKIGEPIPAQVNRDGNTMNVIIKPVQQLSR